MYDEKIIGRWVNERAEYVFSENFSFYHSIIGTDKQIVGLYLIEDSKLIFQLQGSKERAFVIDHISPSELRVKYKNKDGGWIRESFNKQPDNYELKRSTRNFVNVDFLLKNRNYHPVVMMNQELSKTLMTEVYDRLDKPQFNYSIPEKESDVVFYIVLIIGVLVLFISPLLLVIGLPLVAIGIVGTMKQPSKKKFEREKEKYDSAYRAFQREEKLYNETCEMSDKEFKRYMKEREVSKSLWIDDYSIVEDYKKGYSHNFVYHQLRKNLVDEKNETEVHESIAFLQEYRRHPYIADFAYVNKALNLIVLIEIDEPYTLSEREPIHLSEEDHSDRTKFFLKHKVVLIRFSEEQFLFYPKECCDFIKGFDMLIKFNFMFPSLPYIQRWNRYNVYRLIASRYREKYLNIFRLRNDGIENF